MDHLRLSELNFRNAKQMKVLGNREMEQAFFNLAKYHENEYANQYHMDACADHLTDYQMEIVGLISDEDVHTMEVPSTKQAA